MDVTEVFAPPSHTLAKMFMPEPVLRKEFRREPCSDSTHPWIITIYMHAHRPLAGNWERQRGCLAAPPALH